MLTFTNFLLSEDALPANHSGEAIAGTQGDPPVRRKKKHLARHYKAARRYAQFKLDQQNNIPIRPKKNRWREILRTAKQSAPPVNEIIHRSRHQPCNAEGFCHQCRRIGYCILSRNIQGGMQ
jgi:hypothetical protein